MTEPDLEIAPQYVLSALVIPLLKGVIYQETDGALWRSTATGARRLCVIGGTVGGAGLG